MKQPETHSLLERALEEAHLPALLVTLAQLTGDMRLLKPHWRPTYAAYTDNRFGGLSKTEQTLIRDAARMLLLNQPWNSETVSTQPSPAMLQEMMDFVAGTKIPSHYTPLLEEELGLVTAQQPYPSFDTDDLREGAQQLKIVIIGAGMSGVLAGIKLKQAGISFQIFERNADLGGTWLENTYPGCRVDSQNHIYSYSFAPNHDWPQHFSTQDVLLNYFRDRATENGLYKHIRFETSVETARFDEDMQKWHVRTKRSDGKLEDFIADAIISAVGQLNQPKIPDIAGRDDFSGTQFHSARWRHDIDLKNKNVAIIGTGASAFQFIPVVAAQAAHLSIFQRTPPWFSPTPDYHYDVGDGQKWLLKNLPFYANWYRFWLFWTITDGAMGTLKIDPEWKADDGSISEANQKIKNTLVEKIREQVGEYTHLLDKIIPQFPFGGKRTLRDTGQWVETLKRENVDLVTASITGITQTSITTADGMEHQADVIIYGTGFHAERFLQPMKVFGRDGVELTEYWSGDARAYLGMTVPGFPNFFCIYGPNTNLVAQGSIVFFSECSTRYILACLKLLLETKSSSIEPKQTVHDRYNERIDAQNAKMAWGMAEVSNWYKSVTGRVSQNWPFPLVDYWQATRAPKSSDFTFHGRR